MRPFAVAGLQLNVSGRQSNLEHICDRIEMLMLLYPWVQMVVVSELATFGGWTGHAMTTPNDVEKRYCDLAAKHKVWLIPGSLYESTPDGIFNMAPVINPQGEVISRFRKIFPFMPYEQGVQQGTEFCVFDVPDVGRFGVSICYDMWFPETSRTLAAMGAEVILHPTLTGSIDRDVELSIVKATAAMNQCFVIDINGIGDGGNGRSLLVAPTGDVLYQAGSNEEMMPIEIDLDRVRRSREVGLKGLGQPLKSFRDRAIEFDVYNRESGVAAYLDTLGPLEKMARGSHAGLAFGNRAAPEIPDVPQGPQSMAPASMAPAAPIASMAPAAPVPSPAPQAPPAPPATHPPANGGV